MSLGRKWRGRRQRRMGGVDGKMVGEEGRGKEIPLPHVTDWV